jgi:hypothetical protein
VEAVREKWTDERLDDLNQKVDEGFRDMREELRAVRGEMSAMSRSFTSLVVLTLTGFAGIIATVLAHG